MESSSFIYALCEPGTRTVRYIGKADDPKRRLRRHISISANAETHLGCWLRSLKGVPPKMVILCEVAREQWVAAEMQYIGAARALGIQLTNATDGGEGCCNPSVETRKKIGDAHRGKVQSPETCAKMSAARWGKVQSPETRAKIGAARLGRKLSPAHRENISLGRRRGIESRENLLVEE